MAAFTNRSVCIWDATTGTLLHTLQDLELADLYWLKLSFDGQRIAIIRSMNIQVWDVMFGSLIQTIQERDRISITALSPTEPKIASGSISGTICVRDITSGALLRVYETHAGQVLSLEFSSNGQKLASSFQTNKIILIWDLSSASLLPSVKLDPLRYRPWVSSLSSFIFVRSLAFSRNGQSLACARFGVEIWDAESGSMRQMLETWIGITGLAFLLNEEHLACWDRDGTVQVWDVPTGTLLRTFQGKIKRLGPYSAFSPIGERLAFGSADGNVQLWDTAFKSPPSQRYQGHLDRISTLAFSPDGQKLASLSMGRPRNLLYEGILIGLWDVATGSLRRMFSCSNRATSVVFSIDGVELVSSRKRYILDIWNTESGQLLKQEDRSLIDLLITTANPSYKINIIDRWITVNEQRLICVPPDRRVSTFATYGTKVAIGSFSGVVTLLNLDLELIYSSKASPPPNPEHGLETPCDVYDSDSASEVDDEPCDVEDLETAVLEVGNVDEGTIGAVPQRYRELARLDLFYSSESASKDGDESSDVEDRETEVAEVGIVDEGNFKAAPQRYGRLVRIEITYPFKTASEEDDESSDVED